MTTTPSTTSTSNTTEAAASNTSSSTVIFTHGGVFHADDAFSVAALKAILPAAEVRRVFALPATMPRLFVVVDVGGVYDNALKFDHHQEKAQLPPARANGCPRAAFGALWASEWGRDVCGAVAGAVYPHFPWRLGAATKIRDAVDRTLVQGIDALDCGWSPRLQVKQDGQGGACVTGWHLPDSEEAYWDGSQELPPDRPGEALTISHIVRGLNPRYDEPASPAARDALFAKAVEMAEGVLRREILYVAAALMAETEVLAARTRNGGRTLVLPKFLPWQDCLAARPDQADLLYVVFPSERGGFCIQQVPQAPKSMKGRRPLPAAWAGKRGDELAALVNAASAEIWPEGNLRVTASPSLFCDPRQFIGGAATEEEAFLLAELALRD